MFFVFIIFPFVLLSCSLQFIHLIKLPHLFSPHVNCSFIIFSLFKSPLFCSFFSLLSLLLSSFPQSREARLLVWKTRLLVVTSLTSYKAHDLLRRHWTFSMMNTVLLNLDPATETGEMLVYFPYTSNGGARVVGAGRWSSLGGLTYRGDTQRLFTEKFSKLVIGVYFC
ncbi:hypothetical protein E2C01_097735 [Portunus trituberculatus]|uniref:Uncharacterized protein n=1 Tax=Portunus trituberculatus TaxID=210409 RepID=A0A5B7K6I6_PORTR|nr:hypothetical protein [Portunus trituberculatus]